MHNGRFTTLDGLRGWAALIVLVWHALGKTPQFQPLHSAYLAVDMFFMLSGFVVAFAYEERLRRGMTLLAFVRIRLVRLYPLYAVGTAIGVAVALVEIVGAGGEPWRFKPLLSDAATAAFVLPKAVSSGQFGFPLDPPAWSLFFELVVNFLYAAFLPRLSNQALVRIAVISGISLYVVAFVAGTLNVGGGGMEMLAGIPRVTCPFAIGVLLSRRWRDDRFASIPRVRPLFLNLLLLALMLGPEKGVVASFLAPSVVIFGFPLLIALGSVSVGSERYSGIAETLGNLSYPLYVTHMPLLAAAYCLANFFSISSAAALLAAVLLAPVLAWCLFTWADKPIQTFLRSRSRRAHVTHAQSMPAGMHR